MKKADSKWGKLLYIFKASLESGSELADVCSVKRDVKMMVRILALVLCMGILAMAGEIPVFTDVTNQAGFNYEHGYIGGPSDEPRAVTGGVAAGDYDGDGHVDLYVVRGNIGPNLLFRNKGDGSFQEVSAAAGVALDGEMLSGPIFFDYNGDGHLDLLTGGLEGTKPHLLRNRGDGTFQDVTTASGITAGGDTFSVTAGDYDRDGDLDLFLGHWGTGIPRDSIHIWRNNGDGTFTGQEDAEIGITGFEVFDYSLGPNFADINNDGWPDLVISCDFGTSKIFINQGNGTFLNTTTTVISDENGMGSTVADYDHDGDLDWFVSSIWDPDGIPQGHWGVTGNRLYRNRGDGNFDDVTEQAGVRIGWWGWGSSFADFNNDGHLDLVNVNGFVGPTASEFWEDPTRLFMANGDGTFSERSQEAGIVDRAQGRGVVSFDFDGDGDLDLFIANNSGPPKLLRNDSKTSGGFLRVRLDAARLNALGTRIYAETNGVTQMQVISAGNNYVSQQPHEVHFGFGQSTVVDQLRIVWPDGQEQTLVNIPVNQSLVIGAPTQPIPTLGLWARTILILVLAAFGVRFLVRRQAVL